MSKAKLLLILWSAYGRWEREWYTVAELSLLTGLSLMSVYCLVWRLHRWRYIKRKGGVVYQYHIGEKGKRFVEKIPGDVEGELLPYLTKQVKRSGVLTT